MASLVAQEVATSPRDKQGLFISTIPPRGIRTIKPLEVPTSAIVVTRPLVTIMETQQCIIQSFFTSRFDEGSSQGQVSTPANGEKSGLPALTKERLHWFDGRSYGDWTSD
ncbi:hypothetical protein PoB_007343100 [Plakobranchus ocellatus]|uniref:Uncharacterized protein n=1 Tax=Plakobranchus ocellatus TaxID=259542 RepID=A0AAV4DS57_9GAST|nr:hypothetical protein PoB_007343100 [Plakobranchus ocellatus]